jgi:hypothetical protein
MLMAATAQQVAVPELMAEAAAADQVGPFFFKRKIKLLFQEHLLLQMEPVVWVEVTRPQ